MVICPVAIAVGCKKCPIFNVCPAKSIIGDQKGATAEDEKPVPKTASKSAPKSAAGKSGKR